MLIDNKNIDNRDLGGSMIEWLKGRARDQHDLGSKSTRAILLCP